MSYADQVFLNNCRRVLSCGFSDEGMEVRAKWQDGTPAHTKKILHVCDIYQLDDRIVPVLTIRKTGFEKAIDEILWIYQRKSNNVQDLNSHIWDSWAAKSGDEVGSIGKAYGYQIAQKYRHHRYTSGEKLDGYPSAQVCDDWVWLDQIDGVIWSLKNNPADRAIMTNMYNHQDIADMHLRPCAYSMLYSVTKDSDGSMVLNALLNQRSQDALTANNWNVVQYSVLVHMLAQVCGMKVGKFTHMIADYHIYDRHEPIIRELTEKFDSFAQPDMPVLYDNPTFWMNPEVTSFYDFMVDDFKLFDYKYHEFNHKIEVAI